jgi:hypothetical protein
MSKLHRLGPIQMLCCWLIPICWQR